MKLLVAIKDLAVDTFGPVLEVRTEAEAKRMFKNEVKNPESRIARNPEDYELWVIASYNDADGAIAASLVKIARASEEAGA